MAVEFRMPKLGLTMEQGTIVEWLVADGQPVEKGSPVLLIETDKTETEVEASGTGRLRQIRGAGDVLDCGELLGWFLAEGEQPPETVTSGAVPFVASAQDRSVVAPATTVAGITDGRLLSSPNARRVARASNVDLRRIKGTGPGGRIVSEDVEEHLADPRSAAPAPALHAQRPQGRAHPVTLAARQLADLLGVDIAAVAPSTSDWRITREDVALHVRGLLASAARRTETLPSRVAPLSQVPVELIPLTGVRGTIATRMASSLREMAQLTLTMDADMSAVVADRRARKEAATEGRRIPGFTDYVLAATARALRRHPIVNSQIVEEGIALLQSVHVGVAVAAERGLSVPVLRDADRLGLDELAAESFRLAHAARAGKLRLDELEGGTFSVSALGMFGVDAFTPVINPPNTAILGVGRLRDDATVDGDGNIGLVERMTLSLTWDHRAFDGAPAAEFCRTIVELLRSPAELA